MNLSVKFLRNNEYTHCEEEVPEGTQYGFWRIVEHTGAGWFPWPDRYGTKKTAEVAMMVEQARAFVAQKRSEGWTKSDFAAALKKLFNE